METIIQRNDPPGIGTIPANDPIFITHGEQSLGVGTDQSQRIEGNRSRECHVSTSTS